MHLFGCFGWNFRECYIWSGGSECIECDEYHTICCLWRTIFVGTNDSHYLCEGCWKIGEAKVRWECGQSSEFHVAGVGISGGPRGQLCFGMCRILQTTTQHGEDLKTVVVFPRIATCCIKPVIQLWFVQWKWIWRGRRTKSKNDPSQNVKLIKWWVENNKNNIHVK